MKEMLPTDKNIVIHHMEYLYLYYQRIHGENKGGEYCNTTSLVVPTYYD